jgi:hypothetical protein
MSESTPVSVLVGFFEVAGVGPVTVETPVRGTPAEQYARLLTQVKKQCSKAKDGDVRRVGSTIELRTGENSFVDIYPGATVGQLFDDLDESEGESKRVVGSVFLTGTPWDIELVNLRAAGSVRIQLNPKLRGETTMRYSNQINPMRLATDLPLIVKEVVGGDARELKLRFREVKQK